MRFHKTASVFITTFGGQDHFAKMSFGLQALSMVLDRLERPPVTERHPFWIFEWDQLQGVEVLTCCIVLFLAGLLCSAGGIGGGGIYVTVLMVAGRLSPRNAVPLSKAVVFFGALAALVLNLAKAFGGRTESKPQAVIDYNICRLVVPAALIGTLVGVLLNRMTSMVLWTTWTQYQEEVAAAKERNPQEAGDAEQGGDIIAHAGTRQPFGAHGQDAGAYGAAGDSLEALKPKEMEVACLTSHHKADALPRHSDTCIGITMLFVVVISGVVRYHVGACVWELQQQSVGPGKGTHEACSHPVPSLLSGNRLEGWMSSPWVADWTMILTLFVPITVCSVVMMFYSRACVIYEHWKLAEVVKYEAMGVLTGCLAGLVGIGGGLVFSPFFLFMGVEPMIAVATSSTCVIFTSSSTTLQYLFTDRIILSLAVVYGLINVAASYLGTKFVHCLQERFAARRSFISGIVAVGVLISAVLSLEKLGSVSSEAAL
jgi:uncharacterized membrane protein YfcA